MFFCRETHRYSNPNNQNNHIKPIVAFVVEYHPYYTTYLKDHFNLSHPLVAKALSHFATSRLFLNGGVFVMDATRWRENNFTAKCEKLIIENHTKSNRLSFDFNESRSNSSRSLSDQSTSSLIYDTRVGDQAVFYTLLHDKMGCLPAQYNMRRLPKKTVYMLEANFLGTLISFFHFFLTRVIRNLPFFTMSNKFVLVIFCFCAVILLSIF